MKYFAKIGIPLATTLLLASAALGPDAISKGNIVSTWTRTAALSVLFWNSCPGCSQVAGEKKEQYQRLAKGMELMAFDTAKTEQTKAARAKRIAATANKPFEQSSS